MATVMILKAQFGCPRAIIRQKTCRSAHSPQVAGNKKLSFKPTTSQLLVDGHGQNFSKKDVLNGRPFLASAGWVFCKNIVSFLSIPASGYSKLIVVSISSHTCTKLSTNLVDN